MEFANYQLDWPRENLSVRCFVHDVFNYRYHWHEDEYELNILLHGRQECCRGSENFHLDVDDVILVPPGVGHYAEKLTLENLADYAQYNRTYISTLFKQIVGINFHEYLTRVRFQHALIDLALTTDSLTDIALRNGFADLKTFNARFRTTLQRTPAEYRAQLCPERVVGGMQRKYLPCDDPLLQRKLREYLQVGKS